MRVAAVIPTHEHLDYAARTIHSFAETTIDGVAIVVDDASASWDAGTARQLRLAAAGCDFMESRFPESGGLTRSWNKGLLLSRELGCDVAIVTNADVLFTPGWWETCSRALRQGWNFIGPLTNAPGHVRQQRISGYLDGYVVSDEPRDTARIADVLHQRYGSEVVKHSINGFWMAGRVRDWFECRFDDENVFDPKFRMTGNEDEFQRRAGKLGMKIGICKGIFIFHYRSVSRGPITAVLSVGTHRPKT